MVQRLTYRRHHSYNTKSNRIQMVRTPSGKLALQYRKKTGKGVRCSDCKCVLRGVAAVRPGDRHRMTRRLKHVTRAYGGNKCGKCVRERILRAFLLEEQKTVRRIRKANMKK